MVRSPHRHVLFLALVLGAVSSVGCGTAWRVVRDGGSPSPLRGAGPITVSFDYSKLVVGGKTEQAFVEEKKMKEPGYDKTWSDLKSSFETNFVTGLAGGYTPGVQAGAPGQGAHVVVFPTLLTMGKYMVVTSTATRVDANLAFTVNGQPADEIAVTGAESATLVSPSVFQHMPGVAGYLGKVSSRFLASKNK